MHRAGHRAAGDQSPRGSLGEAPAFASGADIGDFVEVRNDPDGAAEHDAVVAAAEQALASVEVPTIAMVHRYCIGGGCRLALACDMRFADDAARFASTLVELGIVYPLEATRRLVETVGPSEAKRMLMSVEAVDAANAYRIGLANEVRSASELASYTYDYANMLATRAQTTVRTAKNLVNRITAGQLKDDGQTRRIYEAAAVGAEQREGIQAFLEGRRPTSRDLESRQTGCPWTSHANRTRSGSTRRN